MTALSPKLTTVSNKDSPRLATQKANYDSVGPTLAGGLVINRPPWLFTQEHVPDQCLSPLSDSSGEEALNDRHALPGGAFPGPHGARSVPAQCPLSARTVPPVKNGGI